MPAVSHKDNPDYTTVQWHIDALADHEEAATYDVDYRV